VSIRAAGLGTALALLAGATAGCGPVHADAVRRTAADFYAAHSARDGAAACDGLAPRTRAELAQSSGKPCALAVLDEDVPMVGEPVAVRVFGSQAEVVWDDETTFLARFRGGWKVTAAACTARAHHPYDCRVAGG